MKKRKRLLPLLLVAFCFFAFLLPIFSLKARAATVQKTISVAVEPYTGVVPTAQTSGVTAQNSMHEQKEGGLGFLLVLLSAVSAGVIVFFYIRHSNQQSLPVALGSERSHRNGVIVR